jgi:uncharacterized protein
LWLGRGWYMDNVIIEICYVAKNQELFFVTLQVPQGTTAVAALAISGVFEKFSELDKTDLNLGIFARKVANDYVLQNLDRLEIYRPLKISPMEARKLRAQKKN